MNEKPICTLEKNSREVYQFRLGEFKGHKFIDMRIFSQGEGKDQAPTKKGLAVSPLLWRQFRQALKEVEQALFDKGWLDREDLDP